MINPLFLNALANKNFARAPLWIMRQAGRYMPSYRKIREKSSLLQMFHESDLVTEVTMLPVNELDVDAAIIFSDILLPLQAFGCELIYENEKPPRVIMKGDFEKILIPTKGDLNDQFCFLTKSIRDLKKILKIPLIGFCGAPFTLASYLLETSSHHLMKKTKTLLYQDEKRFHALLEKLSDLVISYAQLQMDAGVDVIQIFDSWAGVLDQEEFKKCSSNYLKKICKTITDQGVPVIVFTRDSSLFYKELISTGCSCISFDWKIPIHQLNELVPAPTALQGNFDPDFLRAPFDVIERKTKEALSLMKGSSRYIVNLGHGVLPDLPYDGVRCFASTVKSFGI